MVSGLEVKANNEEEAIKKVDNGDWYDEDIQSSKLMIGRQQAILRRISDE